MTPGYLNSANFKIVCEEHIMNTTSYNVRECNFGRVLANMVSIILEDIVKQLHEYIRFCNSYFQLVQYRVISSQVSSQGIFFFSIEWCHVCGNCFIQEKYVINTGISGSGVRICKLVFHQLTICRLEFRLSPT